MRRHTLLDGLLTYGLLAWVAGLVTILDHGNTLQAIWFFLLLGGGTAWLIMLGYRIALDLDDQQRGTR